MTESNEYLRKRTAGLFIIKLIALLGYLTGGYFYLIKDYESSASTLVMMMGVPILMLFMFKLK